MVKLDNFHENIKSVTGYWNLDGSLNAQQKYTNKDRTEIRISCGIENIDSNQADWLKKNIINDYVKILKQKNGLKKSQEVLS